MENDSAKVADALAHAQAGRASAQREDWPRAIAHLRVAVAAAPQVAENWANFASALQHVGLLDDAQRVAQRAVALKPALAPAWNTLALVAMDRGRHDEARVHLARALEADPKFALAHANLGCCEHALGRDADAVASLERALALDPSTSAAHYNLGALRHKQGRHAEAMEHYRRAIALRPADAQSHFNLGLAHFITGDFAQGWHEYSWRSQRRDYAAALRRRGSDYAPPAQAELASSPLAIVAEQGLGDTLFFLRYAPALAARGARLDFAGDVRLHGMLGRTGLFATLARQPEELDDGARIGILAGDLPMVVPALAATTPAPLPLAPDAARLAAMRERLAALGPGPYVGVAWRAGEPKSGRIENLFKEIDVTLLGQALRGVRATWVAIQRDPAPGEIERLSAAIGAPVHDLSAVNAELEDALALLAALDEYVGVSSTLVHLRAGVGGSARVLTPFPYEWRWMESGDASPWFPRAAVYRQSANLDWSEALRRLAAYLATRR